MKRFLQSTHFLAAAAALCLLGCAHESVPETARTWNVSAELSSVSTKVTVDTGLKLHWSKGDNVRLLALGSDASSAEAQLTVYDVDAGLEKAMFKGQIVMNAMPSDCIFAFPYDGTSLSGTSTIYSYTSQNFCLTPCLWGKTAYSESGIECVLSHIGGTIHLTNINSDIISVTLKGNASEPLGQVVVDENGAVSVSGDSEITVMTAGEGYSSEAYINVPPVNFSKGFTVIAQTIGGATQYRSFSTSGTSDSGFDFSPSDGTGKMVEINWEGFTSFGISASASIAHTTDASGNLNGSTVTLNSFTITGAPSKIITEYGVDLYKGTSSEGTLVRTLSLTSLPSSGTGLSDAGTGWPYLPSSNTTYTLLPWCRIHGGEKLYGTSTTLSSPAPTFNIKSVEAYTSYDKYLSGNKTDANNCVAETIYAVTPTPGISSTITENANYKSIISYSYSADSGTYDAASNTFTGCDWGERTISATCTFDGATSQNAATKTCIITGLPCTLQPNNTDWEWTSLYISAKDTYIQMNGDLATTPDITSTNGFFIPAKINITSNFNIYITSYIRSIVNRKSTIKMYIAGTKVYEYQRSSNGGENLTVSVIGAFTSSSNRIKFEANTTQLKHDSAYSRIYSIPIMYGDVD